MSLKFRILIIFSLLTMFFLAVDYGIQRLVILPTYLALEESEAKEDLERASEAIYRELEHVNILCHDWASWDPTYEFIVSNSEEYEDSNLTLSTFKTNRLNLIYFCDRNGKIVWQTTYDVANGWEIRISNILDHVKVKKYLLDFSDAGKPYKTGLLNTEHGAMMLASRPILPSSNEGTARGTLIMGRLLDRELIKKLTSQTLVNFNIIPLHDKSVLEQYTCLFNKFAPGSPYYLEKINEDELKAYSIIPDIENNQALMITLSFPREISKQGIKSINFAIIYILLVGTIVLILFLFFTNSMILIPLSKLTRLIKQVENTGDLSIRSPIRRKDEIGQLSNGFNQMMKKRQIQTEELAAAMKTMKKLATIDPLTDLANRRYFEDSIEKEWKIVLREKLPIGIILCDIDYFKLYNDTYGHQQGDECLKTVAASIKKGVQRPSDLVARYGGEEFIILLPNTKIVGAIHVAERVRKNVEDLEIDHSASKVGKHVSISLGVAGYIPDVEAVYEKLIEAADQALYQSKENGRNRSTVATSIEE